MCGIAGFLDPRATRAETDCERLATAMANTIEHRGPDGAGVFTDAAAGVALAHRRLAIVDLSEAGAQPMTSADGRFTIVYNGEVYNADELRASVPEVSFRGHSDTEAILECIAHHGVGKTLERLIGMFALALWDRETRRLTLVRDRLGIKPLYWGQAGHEVVFGSEMKALYRHPGYRAEIDRSAVLGYLRHAYVPGPHTIHTGIRKLQPGWMVEVEADGTTRETQWWSLGEVVRTAQGARQSLSDAEAVDRLEALAGDAVARRMVADVPVGAFLSGGIDSSLVVALMARHAGDAVRTFTIGFDVPGYDEAEHAKAVAAHLGTRHTELTLTEAEAREAIPLLPHLYDEPFADSSQIPTWLVSRMTREQVTVSLSGDGGDELFAGYNRYLLARNLWRKLGWMPGPVRASIAALIRTLPPHAWDTVARAVPTKLRPSAVGDKAHKLATVLGGSQSALYRMLVSQWDEPAALMPGVEPLPSILADPENPELPADDVERMQFLDTLTYLPDDILTKVDRASMGVSLEARVPLLDHRLVAFAWQLDAEQRLRGTTTKWLLRQVLYRHVPPALVERPKMGFGVPIDTWLRGPLREWAEALLDPRRLAEEGFFDPAIVRQTFDEHLSGRRNWQHRLWVILMFQAWHEQWARPAERRDAA